MRAQSKKKSRHRAIIAHECDAVTGPDVRRTEVALFDAHLASAIGALDQLTKSQMSNTVRYSRASQDTS